MDMIDKIPRMDSRDKYSQRKIAGITQLSRIAISTRLLGEVTVQPRYRSAEQLNKLSVIQEAITQALTATAPDSPEISSRHVIQSSRPGLG
jgi:hypothetical protein